MRLRLPRLCLLARLFRDLRAHPQAQCPFPPRCRTPGHDLPRGCPRPPPPARAVRALPHRPVLPLPLRPMTPPLSPPPLCPPRISLLSHNFSPHKKAACLPRIPLFLPVRVFIPQQLHRQNRQCPRRDKHPGQQHRRAHRAGLFARRAFPAVRTHRAKKPTFLCTLRSVLVAARLAISAFSRRIPSR